VDYSDIGESGRFAGWIRDYYDLCHTLALPSELIAYFLFRQDILVKNPKHSWEEARLAAQFIAETQEPLPDVEVTEFLQDASDDISSFDLAPILRRFGEKVTYLAGSGADLDYYRILGEFSRLSRAEMRGFKRLLAWALQKAGGELAEIPARMQSVNTGTGFVVFPVFEGAFETRLNALKAFATAAKYDFRLERQIGLSVARDSAEVELDWIYIEHPWRYEPEIAEALSNNYPFRPKPLPRTEYRYPKRDR
jgi:hypothetical protein